MIPRRKISSPNQSRRRSSNVPPAKSRHNFKAQTSAKHLERLERARQDGTYADGPLNLQCLFLGIAATKKDPEDIVEVGICAHDGTYSIDFAVHTVDVRGQSVADGVAEYCITSIRKYEEEHGYKFVGAGVTAGLKRLSSDLMPRLWAELDIVPLWFETTHQVSEKSLSMLSVDEEADSMARKCLVFFGPTMQPRVEVGFRNQVEVDACGHAVLASAEDYRDSVGERTWMAATHYIESLKKRNIKIAFFSSTPQGGGVALMRHSLVRFFRLMGVNAKWYVPRPKPEVFRITKTNHNILQGVARPDERLSADQKKTLADWVEGNAKSLWLNKGGPLAPREQGGVDFVIVDDPQMPSLVERAKEADPTRPVIFRSHIQIRSDLADKEGTPASEVWKWLYASVKRADVFVSHPVKEFVPKAVNPKMVGYLPATTDWLDGLNKEIDAWDMNHYMQEIKDQAVKSGLLKLEFPDRDYIVQIARFDPAKGIPDVLESYARLRREHFRDRDPSETPQLVIAGHSAIDDPDGTRIFDETMTALDTQYSDVAKDVIPLRIGPTDQLLNALMTGAKVALQLSTREGFEIKVSEALHKGIPTIATHAGGIPLQVEQGRSGFLVEPGDADAVAKHLYDLFTDQTLYKEMSEYAATHVSDEVSTVGNALSWVYLADTLTKGEPVVPNGRWINDMARETAHVPYEIKEPGEVRLPRNLST